MNELLQDYLVKALGWVESSAGWIVTEIPLYVQELIRWAIVQSSVGVFFGVLIIITGIILGRLGWKRHKEAKALSRSYEDGWMILVVLGPLLFCSSGFGVFITSTLNILKVLVAPRVWLIDYLGEMLI